VTAADWLLLFVAQRPAVPLDPVRLQKGLFLLAASGAVPAPERFHFEPYSYGPMSRSLYRDARTLRAEGLLLGVRAPGRSWELLRPSDAGEARACLLRARARRRSPRAVEQLAAIRRLVDELSFAELLRLVYARHPEYAVNSVFLGR